MTTFLSFDILTTAGPLEVYLQNLKSLRSFRNLPAFEAEGFDALGICRFSGKCPKEIRFQCLRSLRKTEEAEKCTKRIHPWSGFLRILIQILRVFELNTIEQNLFEKVGENL